MNGSHFVARHFDFGHNHDMILCTVLDEVLHLLLCVVARYGYQHVVHAHTRGAFLDKLRILLYFNAPCLVIDQVEVNTVKFVTCHFGHNLLQAFVRNEYAARVNHQLAYMGARCIFDGDRVGFDATGRGIVIYHELLHGHDAIEHTRGRFASNVYAVLVD